MSSGDKESDSESDYNYVPEIETDTSEFVNQFMNVMANGDTENRSIANDIINNTKDQSINICDSVADNLLEVSRSIDEELARPIEECVDYAIDNNIVFNKNTGFSEFRDIALKLFEGGISAGRIIALLIFGYRWIVGSIRRFLTESGDDIPDGAVGGVTLTVSNTYVIKTVIQWLVQFLSTRAIHDYIQRRGGWHALYQSLPWTTIMSLTLFFVSSVYLINQLLRR